MAADLKTTDDASQEGFARSIGRYRYHWQAAMYLAGAKAVGLEVDVFVFIAVEKFPPYQIGIYQLHADDIEQGRKELKPLIAEYGNCQRTDCWPGYPEEVQEIRLPKYARRDYETDAD